jgi:protein-disulfide isomerase
LAYRAAIRAGLAAGGACFVAMPALAQNPPKVQHGPPPIPPIPTELMMKPGEARTAKPKPKPPEPPPKPVLHPVLEDVVMGSAEAPIEIIEYASLTCAACQHFHANVLPELAAGYVLTGDAKYVLRDYATSPIPAANAAAAMARCTGSERYYDTVAELFARQTEIVSAARLGEISGVLQTIGARHGLSAAEVDACIEDPAILAYIRSEAEHAPTGANPPLLLVNGQRVDDLSVKGVRHAIDAALQAIRIEAQPSETAPPPSGDTPPAGESAPIADPSHH